MKIALDLRLTPKIMAGGIGKYAVNLAKHLIAIDNDNSYVIIVNSESAECLKELQPKAELFFSDIPNLSFKEHYLIPRIIKKLKADIYHSPYYVVPAFIGCACISTIHDISPLKLPQNFSRTALIYYNFMLLNTIKKCKRIIVDSNQTASDLTEKFPECEDKIRVIALAAQTNRLQNFSAQEYAAKSAKIKSKYGISGDFIFYLGNLKPHKNLSRLIKAFSHIISAMDTKYTLVIGGAKSDEYKKLQSKADNMGLCKSVIFTGFIDEDDLPVLFKESRLFVYPSLYEGFGLPVLEAMAYGTPVLTSNCTSLAELAANAALLVDPYNIKDISDGMKKILTDKITKDRIAAAGLIRAGEFTWEKTAKQTLGVYAELSKNAK
ncbi:MAG: glycosyltransferase family 4 protein [Candidatus Omnitrophica bacterium]|nr:glycosyltransferase family 4 protein [Candidatus Omnitrophota bacterium]